MKKLLLSLIAIAWAIPVFGQGPAPSAQGALNTTATTCNATNSACVVLAFNPGSAGVTVQVTQTFSGTLQFEAGIDGATWAAVAGTPIAGGALVTSTTSTGTWQFGVSGLQAFRVRASTLASGQAGVFIQASTAFPPVNGTTTSVSIATATIAGNAAASLTGSTVPTSAGYTGVNVGGNLVGVTGTGTSMNVNLTGQTLALATSTKQSDGSQKGQIVDGSGNVIGATANALDVNIKSGGATSLVTINTAATGSVTVAATLNAETTKVIGVVRTADGAGNLLTSTGNAIDTNIKSGLPADAAIGVALATNPVPSGCENETSRTVIATGQAGVLHCTTDQQLIITGSTTPGSVPAGTLALVVQGTSNGIDVPVNQHSLLGVALVANPCATNVPIAFSVTTAAVSSTVVAAVNGQKVYLCDFGLNTADAAGSFVSVVAGTGTTCATVVQTFKGSAANTPTDGWFLAASGGGAVFMGGGVPAAVGSTNGDDLCLFTGGKKTQFSGHYVHQGIGGTDADDWRLWLSILALSLYARRRRKWSHLA